MEITEEIKTRILSGGEISGHEAYMLAGMLDRNRNTIHRAASEITKQFCKPVFDSCSILNARSGKCPENCKWCAQSAHHHTSIDSYPLIGHDECMKVADLNRLQGVKRFSLVTSGRALRGADLEKACGYYAELHRKGGISLCASMGLLDRDELKKLWDAGVRRYHCNLETAPTYFGKMCTTHTTEDKIRTILTAKEIGFEVCSGGIIGMGETMEQRVELALELRRVAPHSIPVNILCPIKGTPLENATPLSDDEVLDTIALFRFIHPRTTLRFAGGRASLSRETQLRAIRIGMNGGVVGDLLTTLGSNVRQDKELVAEAGYGF